MSQEKLRVLLLDDEEDLRVLLANYLQDSCGYQVDTASTGQEALALIEAAQGRHDVALLDQVLRNGMDGIQVMQEIKKRYPDVECIIFTGWGFDTALEALRAGAYRYLAKPVQTEELGVLIRMAAEHRKLKQELETTRQEKEWLETFLEIGKATTSVLDLDQVLEQVHRQVGRITDVSGLCVILYDEKSRMLNFELGFDRGKKQAKWQRPLDIQGGLTDWVIHNRQPLLLGDYPHDLPAFSHAEQPGGPNAELGKSWLGIPLSIQDRVIGAITVQSDEPHRFTQTDQQILTAVASQVAIAIENAQLYSALEERNENLKGLIASSLDAVVAIDKDHHITVFNQQAETMFGYAAEEMQGGSVYRLHWDIEEARKIHDIVSRQGAIPNYETALKDKAGKRIPVRLSATLMKDAQGNEIGQAGFMRDLRHIRSLEDRLHALVHLGQVMSSTLDLDKVLELVVESAVAASPTAQKGSLHLYDEKTGMLHIRASVGYSPKVAQAVTLKAGEGRAGWVYQHAAPLVVGDTRMHELSKRTGLPEEEEQKSSVCVPIMLENRPIGALSLDSITDFDAFGPNDVGLLLTLANQAAVAIENARLYQATLTLHDLGEQLHSTLELESVLRASLAHITRVFRAQVGSITLFESGGEWKKVWEGISDELEKEITPRPAGTGRRVYETGEPAVVSDATHDPDCIHPRLWQEGMRAVILLPLITRERKVIGVFGIYYGRPNAFTMRDVDTFKAYANQVASAIDNARLYEAIRRKVEELERLRLVGQAIVGRVIEKPKGVLEQIAVGACQVIGADSAVIYPYLAESWTYDVENIGSYGLKSKKTFDAAKRRGELKSMTGLVLREGILVVDDAASSVDRSGQVETHAYESKFLQREDVKSFCGISLVVGDEAVGALFVNFRTAHYFTDEELSIISILANQAAVAIKQARLFELVNQGLERRKKEQEATQAVAALMGSVFDLRTVWQEILDGGLRITGAKRGHILLWDMGQRKLSLEVSQGIPDREQAYLETQLAQGAGFTDWVMQHRQATLIHDVAHDPNAGWYLPTSIATRAALVAPVLQDDSVIGVINLESTLVGAFGQNDLQLVENLALYAGMAVQNAIRYDETQQNSILREGLLKAGQSITALQEPEAVLQAIADSARQALSCDVVTLYTYKQDIEEIGFPAVISGELRSPDRLQEIRNIRKESVVGQLVAAGSPHFADDSIHDGMMTAGAFVQRESIRSSAGIPLRVGDQTLGILFVNYRTPHSFSQAERSAVELFATQAAITIYNASLFKSVQRQSRHRQALYDSSKAITAGFTMEPGQVLNRIVEQAVERITGVDGPKATWGTIQRYNPVTQELVFENIYPSEASSLVKGQLGDRLRLGGTKTLGGRIGITGRVVVEGKPQRVKDVHEDPDYVEYDSATKSELAVPLVDGEETVGVLSVESDQLGAFDEGDEEALKGLAELAMIAIKNAQQARQLGRTNAFAAMGAWGAEIAHEVNREVGNIRLVVDSLKRRSDLAQEVIEDLAEIDSYAEKLGLPALPEQAPQPGQVIEFKDAPLLDDVMEEAIEAVGQELEQKSSINVEPDLQCEGIRVAMHPYWLSRLTHHLVRNAIRSTPAKEKGNRITVRTQVQDTLAEIAVQDTGPGVPPDKIPLLFNQPILSADGHQGRGLLVVSYIAGVYGGSARLVWNRVGEGACFAFYVPLAEPADRKRGK